MHHKKMRNCVVYGYKSTLYLQNTALMKKLYIICMIKNAYFMCNYSINCWGRFGPRSPEV